MSHTLFVLLSIFVCKNDARSADLAAFTCPRLSLTDEDCDNLAAALDVDATPSRRRRSSLSIGLTGFPRSDSPFGRASAGSFDALSSAIGLDFDHGESGWAVSQPSAVPLSTHALSDSPFRGKHGRTSSNHRQPPVTPQLPSSTEPVTIVPELPRPLAPSVIPTLLQSNWDASQGTRRSTSQSQHMQLPPQQSAGEEPGQDMSAAVLPLPVPSPTATQASLDAGLCVICTVRPAVCFFNKTSAGHSEESVRFLLSTMVPAPSKADDPNATPQLSVADVIRGDPRYISEYSHVNFEIVPEGGADG
jgi:hypothetical protein